jgi:hypothetical protein
MAGVSAGVCFDQHHIGKTELLNFSGKQQNYHFLQEIEHHHLVFSNTCLGNRGWGECLRSVSVCKGVAHAMALLHMLSCHMLDLQRAAASFRRQLQR